MVAYKVFIIPGPWGRGGEGGKREPGVFSCPLGWLGCITSKLLVFFVYSKANPRCCIYSLLLLLLRLPDERTLLGILESAAFGRAMCERDG